MHPPLVRPSRPWLVLLFVSALLLPLLAGCGASATPTAAARGCMV